MKAEMRYALASAILLSCMMVIGCQQQADRLAAASAPRGSAAPPAPDNGAAFFHDRLARAGEWIDTVDYGPCWYPTDVRPAWRPYTDGRWTYTIGSGWLWVGAEKW